MTESPGLDRLASERLKAIGQLRRYRTYLTEELRRTDDALRVLKATEPVSAPRPAPEDGTYALLRQFIASQREGGEDVKAYPAWAWMKDHGWSTRARDEVSAVASALAQMVRWGDWKEWGTAGTGSMRGVAMSDALRIQVTASRFFGAPDVIGNGLGRIDAENPDRRIVLAHGKCDPRTRVGRRSSIAWAAAETFPAEKQLALLGGDWLCDRLARRLGWGIEMFPADWDAPCQEQCRPGHRKPRSRFRGAGDYCPMAGHYRNARMIALPVRMCLAFFAAGESNSGTLDCSTRALAAGIATLCFCDKCPYPQLQPCHDHSLAPLLRGWGKAVGKTRVPDEQPEVKLW